MMYEETLLFGEATTGKQMQAIYLMQVMSEMYSKTPLTVCSDTLLHLLRQSYTVWWW